MMIIALTWLWQGLALAGLTVLLLRALPHLNAATRHALWWAALIAVLGIPLVLATGGVPDVLPASTQDPESEGVGAALVLPAAPGWVALLCASAWILSAVAGLIRVAHGCRLVRVLRDASTPIDADRERHLRLWCETRAGARRPTELRISEGLAGACALGFRRPVILLGRTLVDRLDDAALDQVVMHEHAHVARYDDWLQLLQAVARAVGGLHPAVWWLSRRIDLDREAACDDYVVARTGAARQYAAALLDAAVAVGDRPAVLVIVPGATSQGSALRIRVARLLDPARVPGVRVTPIAAVGVLLPVIAILAGPRVAPLVAFVDAVEQALPIRTRAVFGGGLTTSRYAVDRPAAIPSKTRALGSGRRASSASRRPEPTRAELGAADEPSVSAATGWPGSLVPAVAPPPVESRRVFERADARLLSALPAATMNSLSALAAHAPDGGRTPANRSLPGAEGAVSAVASGAERSGLAIGRAFARAGRSVAGKF